MQKRTYTAKEIKFCRLNLAPDFPIQLMRGDKWCATNQAITMLHFHNCIQVGYCYEGQGYSLIEGVLYPYEAESVSVIPAKALHFCTSQPNLVSRWKWLYIDPLGLMPQLGHTQKKALMEVLYGEVQVPYTVKAKENPQLVQLVQCIIYELETAQNGYKDAVRGLVQAFVTTLLRLADDRGVTTEHTQEVGLQVIVPAIEHISICYMEPVSVPLLAELCHISPTHLRRMFHKIMGCSPLDYLQLTRMEAACSLLMNSDISVLEVGSQAGFPTGTSFTKQFKKIFGTTPGRWRVDMLRTVKG